MRTAADVVVMSESPRRDSRCSQGKKREHLVEGPSRCLRAWRTKIITNTSPPSGHCQHHLRQQRKLQIFSDQANTVTKRRRDKQNRKRGELTSSYPFLRAAS